MRHAFPDDYDACSFWQCFPALAICIFALGLIQYDGLLIIFGIIVTVISAILISAFSKALALLISKIWLLTNLLQ